MRLNAVPGLRATVTALPGQHPPRIRLAAGPFTFTVDPDEALSLADRLVDAVEAIRNHRPNPKGQQPACQTNPTATSPPRSGSPLRAATTAR